MKLFIKSTKWRGGVDDFKIANWKSIFPTHLSDISNA